MHACAARVEQDLRYARNEPQLVSVVVRYSSNYGWMARQRAAQVMLYDRIRRAADQMAARQVQQQRSLSYLRDEGSDGFLVLRNELLHTIVTDHEVRSAGVLTTSNKCVHMDWRSETPLNTEDADGCKHAKCRISLIF